MKQQTSHHEILIRRGLRFHESFRYSEALPFFKEAIRLSPNCPSAIYNLANTLHMLGKDKEAHDLLSKLLRMSDNQLASGCPVLKQPASFRTDAYYLMFHLLLSWKSSWLKAFPFAQKHLRQRRRGLKSAWSLATIRGEIAEFRKIHLRPQK